MKAEIEYLSERIGDLEYESEHYNRMAIKAHLEIDRISFNKKKKKLEREVELLKSIRNVLK